MNEETFRMLELSQQGFHCSQIIMIMGLESRNESNPDLVRAMTGLAGGIGFCGRNCGSLTGAACLISLYAGKGAVTETEDSRLNLMISELVEWFDREYASRYGGIDCTLITGDDPRMQAERCPEIVLRTYQKAREILNTNGFV